MDQYFIITAGEDGGRIEAVNKETLLKRLDTNYYGNAEFLDRITESDFNYWGDGEMAIIKGSLVTPKPVETVTRHMID